MTYRGPWAGLEGLTWGCPAATWRQHALAAIGQAAGPWRTLCGRTVWTYTLDAFRQRCAACELIAMAGGRVNTKTRRTQRMAVDTLRGSAALREEAHAKTPGREGEGA